MREAIWRNILLVRTFFDQSARGLLRRGESVSAVPRLRKQGGVTTLRARSHLGSVIRITRSETQAVSNNREAPSTGKPTGLRYGALSLRRKEIQLSMPRSSSVRPVVASVGNKGRAKRVSALSVSARQVFQPRVEHSQYVSIKKHFSFDTGEGSSSARRMGVFGKISRPKPVRRMGTDMLSVVRGATRGAGNSLFVPPPRALFAKDRVYETTGQEQHPQHVFSGSRTYHDTEVVNDRLEHEVRGGDFLLGHREARLAARRSGGGVDEIMQPQYPGRSIGFF